MAPDQDRPTARAKPRSRLLRAVYFILGLVSLGLVYMSVLPGIPTFDFVILAAFFFSMSSDRFYDWLVGHPVFGRMIRGYRRDGLTPRMKWLAVGGIVASLSFSALVLVEDGLIRLILAAVGVYAAWFVLSRPGRTGSGTGSKA